MMFLQNMNVILCEMKLHCLTLVIKKKEKKFRFLTVSSKIVNSTFLNTLELYIWQFFFFFLVWAQVLFIQKNGGCHITTFWVKTAFDGLQIYSTWLRHIFILEPFYCFKDIMKKLY